jgi:hypothetical protein
LFQTSLVCSYCSLLVFFFFVLVFFVAKTWWFGHESACQQCEIWCWMGDGGKLLLACFLRSQIKDTCFFYWLLTYIPQFVMTDGVWQLLLRALGFKSNYAFLLDVWEIWCYFLLSKCHAHAGYLFHCLVSQ